MRSKREVRKTEKVSFQKKRTHPRSVGEDGKLDPPYKSFVNLNFKVEGWYHTRFKLEASLRGMSGKSLLEACFQAYLDQNGGTLEKPRQDLVDRFMGKRTNTRRSRRLS